MARPEKHTVKYFPHDVDHGLTIETLDAQYGIKGYYFWFRLLELLGKTKNHYLDISNKHVFLMLQNYTKTNAAEATEILNLLSELEAIDEKLLRSKIIYSQNFIDGIADVYKKRKNEVPKKPETKLKDTKTVLLEPETELTDTLMDETKLNKSKLNKTKVNKTISCQLKVDVPVYQDIINLFHEILPELPKVRILSDSLKKNIKTFINSAAVKQISQQENFTDNKQFFEWYFGGIKLCPFLMGINDTNWQADFHWIIKSSNAEKIIGGRFTDKKHAKKLAMLKRTAEAVEKASKSEGILGGLWET